LKLSEKIFILFGIVSIFILGHCRQLNQVSLKLDSLLLQLLYTFFVIFNGLESFCDLTLSSIKLPLSFSKSVTVAHLLGPKKVLFSLVTSNLGCKARDLS